MPACPTWCSSCRDHLHDTCPQVTACTFCLVILIAPPPTGRKSVLPFLSALPSLPARPFLKRSARRHGR